MTLPRVAFCLFCDDARQEVGGKMSYMGVLPPNLAFPDNPPPEIQLLIPKLVIALWLLTDREDKFERVTISVSIPPGRTELLKFEVPSEQIGFQGTAQEWSQRIGLNMILPFINLTVPCEGFIEVDVETEREKLHAGRLRLVIPGRPDPTILASEVSSSSPTASPQPSEQSPPSALASKPRVARRRPSTHRSRRTPEPE
jgi:hypothetical protein